MGEGEKPEGLSPEEVAARLMVDPKIEVGSAEPVPFERAETDLEYEASLPDIVGQELGRLNTWAEEQLQHGSMPAGHPEYEAMVGKVEQREPSPADSESPSSEGDMHQPIETKSDRSRDPDTDSEVRAEKQRAMVEAFNESALEYIESLKDAKGTMESTAPHTRATWIEFHGLMNAQGRDLDLLRKEIIRGSWIDPVTIRAMFQSRGTKLLEFTRTHPANS